MQKLSISINNSLVVPVPTAKSLSVVLDSLLFFQVHDAVIT